MTPEGKVKAEIRKYLESIKAYVFMPVQTGYGVSTLDMLCCVRGKFLAIECKRPSGGKLTERQARIMTQIGKANGRVLVATSVDDVRTAVREIFGTDAP